MPSLSRSRTCILSRIRSLFVFTFCLTCGTAFLKADPGKPGFRINFITPRVVYPGTQQGKAQLSLVTLFSERLRSATTSNITLFLNQERVIPVDGPPPEPPRPHTVYAATNSKTGLLDLWFPSPDYAGKVRIQLETNELSESAEIVVAAHSKWAAGAYAKLAALCVLLLPYVLIRFPGKTHTFKDSRYGIRTELFLDKETGTYSLSRFQFYAWTAAALFAYLSLIFARSLTEGEPVFANIPRNLPGVILVSAATTALAQAITASRGAKGAGQIRPCLADFVTSGGLVAIDRLQFFVWTIIGVAIFLSSVIFSYSADLSDLPKIPDQFWALMGVSSLGYLGGKLVRKPGPIINEITARVGSLICKYAADIYPRARVLTLTVLVYQVL